MSQCSSNKLKLLYVKFLDHVIFRGVEPFKIKPVVRETIGWVFDENDHAITLIWVKEPEGSAQKIDTTRGICILKQNIIQMREVEVT